MAFVYVLKSGDRDAYKIGKTRSRVLDRKKALGTGNPDRMSVFDSIETQLADLATCESFLHGTLASKRITESDGTEWFRLTVPEIEEAIEAARHYLATDIPRQAEADRLAKIESDHVILQPGDEEWKTYQRMLELLEQECLIGIELERLKPNLKLLLGKASRLDGIATWKTYGKMELDQKALEAEEPELYAFYRRPRRVRPFKLL